MIGIEDIPMKCNYDRFRPTKTGEVFFSNEQRTYRAVCLKGVIDKYFYVLPFGYTGDRPWLCEP